MVDDLSGLSARQLFERTELALRELRDRGIVRTRNAPLGDIAERIVWIARGGTLEPNSMKSHDVTTVEGARIQVKARIMRGGNGTFSAFRSLDFTSAIFLSFDPITLDINYARELTRDQVASYSYRSEWVNATTLTGAKVEVLGVDVTEEMRLAYARLDESPLPS